MLEIRPILSALSRHKSRTLLILLQIAITFAVVVNSIAIVKQRLDMMARETGIDEAHLLSLNINVFDEDYNFEQNIRADLDMLRNMPGVANAVVVNQVPLSGSGDSSSVAASQEQFDKFENFGAGFFMADNHLVNTLGVKLIEGRNFTEEEVDYVDGRANAKVTIITKSLADKLFPNGDALGKTVYLGGDLQPTIIGITERQAGSWVHHPIFMDNMLFPIVRLNRFHRVLIRVKTQQDLTQMLAEVEDILIKRNNQRVITWINSMQELKDSSYAGDNAMTKILWTVSVLLIVITALGIVGIVSFNVNQRTKQIGTRRALGAQKSDIQRYFITENILLTSIGLAIGCIICVGLNMLLVEKYDATPIDWQYFPIGIGLMLILGILSVWWPARKASNIPPTIATQTT